jgi:hypothetical protein
LSGSRPFGGETGAQARRDGKPAPLPTLAGRPSELDSFFARALQADPARRFRSGAELLLALRSVVSPAVS